MNPKRPKGALASEHGYAKAVLLCTIAFAAIIIILGVFIVGAAKQAVDRARELAADAIGLGGEAGDPNFTGDLGDIAFDPSLATKDKGLRFSPDLGTPFPFIDASCYPTAAEIRHKYGIRFNYMYRTYAWQMNQWLKRPRNPNGVAQPGTSRHEAGFAIDTDFRSISEAERAYKRKVFATYGYAWLGRYENGQLAGDPVHFERDPATIWGSRAAAIRAAHATYRQLTGR